MDTSYYNRFGAEELTRRLSSETLLAQGPMGSVLLSEYDAADIPPAFWNLAEPQTVSRIHRLYVAAGAQVLITNYPEVAEYIIGATTLTVVDDSGVPVSPINSQDAVHAGMIGAAAGLAVALLLVFIYVRTRKTIRQADDVKKLTNAAFLGNLPEAKIKKR